MVSSPSCIQVPHDDELVLTVHFPEEGPYVTLEGPFGRGVCHKCESVQTDDGGESIALEGKTGEHGAIRVSHGEAGRLAGQRVLQHEAYFGQATILPPFARPVQGVSCSVLRTPCSVSDPCAAKRTSPRAAIWCRCKVGLVPVPPVVSIVMIGQLRRSLALSGYSSMLT